MSMLKEFRDFAMKGNVVDMAVGIIIGGAFGTIVSSLVKDVLMPPIGMLMGRVDFSSLFINLSGKEYASLAEARAAGAATINYGLFINTVINFLLVAWTIFIVIKGMNTLQRKSKEQPPAAPPAPTREEVLLTEIRDLLKK